MTLVCVTRRVDTYLETVILVLVSSRIFLIILPSLPMIRPQYRSSANIFSIISLCANTHIPYTDRNHWSII